jgi:hypothetical protein
LRSGYYPEWIDLTGGIGSMISIDPAMSMDELMPWRYAQQ